MEECKVHLATPLSCRIHPSNYSCHTQMANLQSHSLPPYMPVRRTPLLAHRQSRMSFHPPTLHPPTTPPPATPSHAPPQYPAFQCPAPILKCHAEIITDVPAPDDPPAYAPARSQAPQDGLTPPPTPLATPPAHDTTLDVVALCLWCLEHPMHLLREGACYLSTRIVCLDFILEVGESTEQTVYMLRFPTGERLVEKQ